MQKNWKISAIQISTTAKYAEIGLGWAGHKKNNCHPEHDQSDDYWHNQSAMETFDETHSCSKSQLCGWFSTNERAGIVDQSERRDLSRQNFTPPPPNSVPGSAKPAESFLTPQLLWTYALNILSALSLISS